MQKLQVSNPITHLSSLARRYSWVGHCTYILTPWSFKKSIWPTIWQYPPEDPLLNLLWLSTITTFTFLPTFRLQSGMGGDLNLKVRLSSMSSSSNSPVHVNTFPTFDFPFVWKRPELAQYRSALPFTHLHGATHMDHTLAFGINSCLIRATKQLPDYKDENHRTWSLFRKSWLSLTSSHHIRDPFLSWTRSKQIQQTSITTLGGSSSDNSQS